ncbi:MAG TPA: IS1595 family transposase [Candidatus Binatia bacterium]|nr:IS1595 family transposase [Candidatus Binatia bacterium]
MDAEVTTPETLLQAVRYFADPDRALAFMAAVRWPDGNVTCPTCGSREVSFLSTRRLWKCKNDHAKRQFSIKVGTIMEDSPIGLDKWLPAIWLITNCKNGISSYEVARGLKITQKSAWFMLHRIRLAMQTGSFEKIGGPGSTVEVDETYIGGAARSMNRKRRVKAMRGRGSAYATPRAIVLGMLERGGRVRVRALKRATRWDLWGGIKDFVEPETELHTDELVAYKGIDADDEYAHKVVNHTMTYVEGNVHTNGIENFWSLLKRAIRGTYVSVEPFHLFRYLDEQAFRFNERKGTDGSRFVQVLGAIVGRRLTYKQLIGLNAAMATPT